MIRKKWMWHYSVMLGHIRFIQRSLQDNHRTAPVLCTLYELENEIMFPLGSRGFSTWDSPLPAPDPMLFVRPQFLLWWPSLCCLWSIYLFYVIRKAVILILDFRWFDVLMYQGAKKPPKYLASEDLGLGICLFALRSWVNCLLSWAEEPQL